jgi:hypothetical protein
MGGHRVVALLALLAVLPVYPLAFATPIDPSSPGGFYDNGDLDDVIEFLCGCTATITPVWAPVEPWWVVVASIRGSQTPTRDLACHSTCATRAPPEVGLLVS